MKLHYLQQGRTLQKSGSWSKELPAEERVFMIIFLILEAFKTLKGFVRLEQSVHSYEVLMSELTFDMFCASLLLWIKDCECFKKTSFNTDSFIKRLGLLVQNLSRGDHGHPNFSLKIIKKNFSYNAVVNNSEMTSSL